MPSSLISIVENLGRPRIAVIGDLILDRYVWGDAERISQEAPVILMRAHKREERLGGSASVAAMLAELGADVALATVVGDDDAGRRSRELLVEQGIDDEFVLVDPNRPTTLKERYVGLAQHRHAQQMMRVDYEVRDDIEDELVVRLASALELNLTDYDLVLISDYNKGVCTPPLNRRVIEACREQGKRVLVDPVRGGNYVTRYRGCTTMTPNRLEAGLATDREIDDLESAADAADELRRSLDMEVGIVTLDRQGMVLVDREGNAHHHPVRPRQIYDITGAGDMVLAVLGLVLAAGHDYAEAIALANTAGGLEVEQFGVATITREQIIGDLIGNVSGRSKVVSQTALLKDLEQARQSGQSIVFTNGCFDILHAGHVHYLKEAKAQGDLLVVGLNSDASVRSLGKAPDRPINDQASRAAVLSALECVDYVCLFEEETPLELIEAVRPGVLVKGADYRLDEVVGRDVVECEGGRVHLAELVPGQSTTSMLSVIRGKKEAA
ncbi:Bifunctional protein HldE [Planctomycetes bacterium Pan216]|uniref:Bifunctional protein HldE n=1 Tax=Kolteria novifilia TaxID=2527975 RepID=A0A518AYN2_9BACT|nr:Bifunctional protein HldE [Planctomycetes bacterium Pan216]